MTDSGETVRCTNCNRDILSSNFVIHDIHCQRNIYLCSKCGEPVNHNQKSAHDEANHVLVFCNNCHAQIEKLALNSHLVDDCPYRKIKCQICDIEVSANDISDHENYCGARTEKCVDCGEFVMLKYKQLHIESNHIFIKLSDEPGPSPSWQNGRRTLGNFFPDLPTLNSMPQSSQRKKYGKSEFSKCRSKLSSECCNTSRLPIFSSEQNVKHKSKRGHRHNISAVDPELSNVDGGKVNNTNDSTLAAAGVCSIEDVQCVQGVSSYQTECAAKGKKETPTLFVHNEKGTEENLPTRRPRRKCHSKAESYSVEDSDLALAIELSSQLKDDFQLENDKLIAQSVEESAAFLSELSLFDSADKRKGTMEKNESRNICSNKKFNKKRSKKQLLPSSKNLSDDEEDMNYDHVLSHVKKQPDDVDDVDLPCQFCGCLYPASLLTDHQIQCNPYDTFDLLRVDEYCRSNGSAEKDLFNLK